MVFNKLFPLWYIDYSFCHKLIRRKRYNGIPVFWWETFWCFLFWYHFITRRHRFNAFQNQLHHAFGDYFFPYNFIMWIKFYKSISYAVGKRTQYPPMLGIKLANILSCLYLAIIWYIDTVSPITKFNPVKYTNSFIILHYNKLTHAILL